MRGLVLGAGGLLGQELCRELTERGHHAVACDRSDADITIDGAVASAIESSGATHVFNCAAYTAVDLAEEEEAAAFAVNAAGAGRAAREAAAEGLPFFHLSTEYVFDGTLESGYSEGDEAKPLSAYGRSKAAGERRVLDAHSEACIVRTQWLFGAGGGNFVETMLRLGSERSELSVVNDQFGSPTWSQDLAASLVTLGESNAKGIYHLTNSETTSWFGFARAIFELAEMDVMLRPVPTVAFPRPAPRPLHAVLQNNSWQSDGHRALRSWKAALASYLAARKENT